jgi:hypothetical protein
MLTLPDFRDEIVTLLADLVGVRTINSYQTLAISVVYSTEILEGSIEGLEVVIDLFQDSKSKPYLSNSLNSKMFTVILKQWLVSETENPANIQNISVAIDRLANKYKDKIKFIPVKLEPGLNILSVVSCQITYEEFNLND